VSGQASRAGPRPGPVGGAGRGARTLIIGWDGATWDLAAPFVEAGDLPTLATLMRAGGHGPLRSTTPPMTLPSWSSVLTGCNPGKHGIFDFVHRQPGSWRLQFTNATWRQVPTLHRILSDRGARVVSLAVPTTWPPDPIDGVVVSGFDSPVATGIDGSFCHPPELHEALLRRFGGMAFADFQERRIGPGWHDDALTRLLAEVDRKRRIAEWLLGQERWDLFMLVFGESDTVSHHFWMFHDPDSPRHPAGAPARLREAIRSVYRALDRALGQLLEMASPDLLCICSDHGFGGAGAHVLFLNRFLEESGLLRYRHGRSVARGRTASGIVDGARSFAVERLPAPVQQRIFRALPGSLLGLAESRVRYGDIDLAGSRAVSDELNYAATIHLDVGPRQRDALIDELSARLLDWRVDGHAPVVAVHRREEIYSGPWVERSADLVLELALRDGYAYTLLPSLQSSHGRTWRRLQPDEHAGGKGLGMNGSHRPDGLLLLWGRGVVPGPVEGARVEDVAPTLLSLSGEAVPTWFDGRSVLEGERGRRASAAGTERAGGRSTGPRATLPDEAAAIRRRLERLGYL